MFPSWRIAPSRFPTGPLPSAHLDPGLSAQTRISGACLRAGGDMANDIAAYEKLGAFYLGRPYDAARGEAAPAPLPYDSRDLRTHAVAVGMTGSVKPGLLI